MDGGLQDELKDLIAKEQFFFTQQHMQLHQEEKATDNRRLENWLTTMPEPGGSEIETGVEER